MIHDNIKCFVFYSNESKSFDDHGNLQNCSHVSIICDLKNQFQQRTRKLPDKYFELSIQRMIVNQLVLETPEPKSTLLCKMTHS